MSQFIPNAAGFATNAVLSSPTHIISVAAYVTLLTPRCLTTCPAHHTGLVLPYVSSGKLMGLCNVGLLESVVLAWDNELIVILLACRVLWLDNHAMKFPHLTFRVVHSHLSCLLPVRFCSQLPQSLENHLCDYQCTVRLLELTLFLHRYTIIDSTLRVIALEVSS